MVGSKSHLSRHKRVLVTAAGVCLFSLALSICQSAQAELILELDRIIRPASIFDGSETVPGEVDLEDGVSSLAFDKQSGHLFLGGPYVGGLDLTTDMPVSGFNVFGGASAIAIHPVTREFYVYSTSGGRDDIENATAHAQVFSPEGDRLRTIDPGFLGPDAATFNADGELFLVEGLSVYPVDLVTGAVGDFISNSTGAFPELGSIGLSAGADFDPLTGNLVGVTGGGARNLAKFVKIDPETWTVLSVSAPFEKGFESTSSLAFNADGSQLFLGTNDDEAQRSRIYVFNRVPEPTSLLLAILGLAATLAPLRHHLSIIRHSAFEKRC